MALVEWKLSRTKSAHIQRRSMRSPVCNILLPDCLDKRYTPIRMSRASPRRSARWGSSQRRRGRYLGLSGMSNPLRSSCWGGQLMCTMMFRKDIESRVWRTSASQVVARIERSRSGFGDVNGLGSVGRMMSTNWRSTMSRSRSSLPLPPPFPSRRGRTFLLDHGSSFLFLSLHAFVASLGCPCLA